MRDLEYVEAMVDPSSNLRAGFVASTENDRADFDITWNRP
jgi:polyisoprenoid-binding protein YceI